MSEKPAPVAKFRYECDVHVEVSADRMEAPVEPMPGTRLKSKRRFHTKGNRGGQYIVQHCALRQLLDCNAEIAPAS